MGVTLRAPHPKGPQWFFLHPIGAPKGLPLVDGEVQCPLKGSP